MTGGGWTAQGFGPGKGLDRERIWTAKGVGPRKTRKGLDREKRERGERGGAADEYAALRPSSFVCRKLYPKEQR